MKTILGTLLYIVISFLVLVIFYGVFVLAEIGAL